MALISIGQIIDRAWHHYTTHFKALISISGWLLIVAILNIVATWFYPEATMIATTRAADFTASEWFGIALYTLTFFVATPVISIWVSNMLMQTIDKQDSGKTINSKEQSALSWKLFFPRVLIGLQVGGMILATGLLIVPGGVLSAAIDGENGVKAVASLILIVGIIATVLLTFALVIRLFFAPFALVLDGKHGRAALKESLRLTRGRWFATFIRLLIPQALFYLGLFLAQIIVLYGLQAIILAIAGLNIDLAIRLYSIAQGTVFLVLTIFMNPLILSANTIVYKNLRETAK